MATEVLDLSPVSPLPIRKENQFCFMLNDGVRKQTRRESSLRSLYSVLRLPILFFAGLVAFGEAIRPDPIPNSAVKRLRANGTLSQDTGE
jgi:hypothetical protein